MARKKSESKGFVELERQVVAEYESNLRADVTAMLKEASGHFEAGRKALRKVSEVYGLNIPKSASVLTDDSLTVNVHFALPEGLATKIKSRALKEFLTKVK